ncbi:MAG: hypothetical protein M1834_007441 [Cirrosporium novae-zelandiae]|nr:MAG: hypothetical protein M1834_007441 [Cirrosporium novae-zelandiae]
MSSNVQEKTGAQGAAIYSRWLLAIYDWWVLGVVNSYAWRCRTTKVLLPFFRENMGKNHLDIGVGTGYFLSHAKIPADVHMTLADLNPNALEASKAKMGRPDTECILHDIFEPLPTKQRFNSVSMFYLLHCMPGPPSRKTAIFDHLKFNLTRDGVVYGATILGTGVKHNLFGKAVLKLGNTVGFFDNRKDSEEAVVESLRRNFHEVESRTVGAILLFKAKKPLV